MGRSGNIDIKNTDKKIIAEIKNKHNTMNARSAVSVYDNLAGWLDFNDKTFKAYVVGIVPKNPKPREAHFAPSERGTKRPLRANLVQIDGNSFYSLASGDANALKKLYDVLPKVLGELLNINPSAFTSTGDFIDLFNRAYVTKNVV